MELLKKTIKMRLIKQDALEQTTAIFQVKLG